MRWCEAAAAAAAGAGAARAAVLNENQHQHRTIETENLPGCIISNQQQTNRIIFAHHHHYRHHHHHHHRHPRYHTYQHHHHHSSIRIGIIERNSYLLWKQHLKAPFICISMEMEMRSKRCLSCDNNINQNNLIVRVSKCCQEMQLTYRHPVKGCQSLLSENVCCHDVVLCKPQSSYEVNIRLRDSLNLSSQSSAKTLCSSCTQFSPQLSQSFGQHIISRVGENLTILILTHAIEVDRHRILLYVVSLPSLVCSLVLAACAGLQLRISVPLSASDFILPKCYLKKTDLDSRDMIIRRRVKREVIRSQWNDNCRICSSAIAPTGCLIN
uniref:Uncharacterized protein n=1 Tax=Glossina pallidipes TaxID=7398 RepID=A0A1A9ZRJ5_GLOPL